MDIAAWIILRIAFAWLFLYALKGLLSDWNATKNLVRLIVPFAVNLSSIMMICVMALGALSILLGIWGQIGGIFLTIYCLIGARVHYRLASLASASKLSDMANDSDSKVLAQIIDLGVAGNITSAQKNFVLAAISLFFAILGTGPLSLTGPLY